MGLSTNLVSGLASGFDWRSMIDELMEIEHRRVDLIEDKKSDYEAKLSEWQSFNTKLLAFKTAAAKLKDPESFHLYTSSMTADSGTLDPAELLSASTSTSASPGIYTLQITQLARSQKLSSTGFSDYDQQLGLDGEFVINGRAIIVEAGDTLRNIRDRINNLNTGTNPIGVTATILSVGSSDHRLILTSDATGRAGIDLRDASLGTSNILQQLGFTYSSSGSSKTIKNVTGTSAQRSDYFSARTSSVATLLGLTSGQSSDSITIGDRNNISIDLAADSLDDIKAAIDAANPTGVTTSVVETTVGGQRMYYLKIEGTTSFGDQNNILETLGILKSDVETVSAEVQTADRSNTTDGSTAITSTTRWRDVYGADVSSNDSITITGTDHYGNVVSGSLAIDDTRHRVQELLDVIETTFGGNVTASIIDGKIRVSDNVAGDSQLSVNLTEQNQGGGALDFGTISTTTVNVGSARNTTDGSTAINGGTTWAEIYGADVAVNDTITITGTDHNGNTLSASLTIDSTAHAVQELVDEIESMYSDTVTASITSEGKLLVVDKTSGISRLSLSITANNEGGGSLDFGLIEVAHGGNDRELISGSDAILNVDGFQISSSNNTVDDVIAGVMLDLTKADPGTTITMNIDRDVDTIVESISDFVDKYNEIANYISSQQDYDQENETSGGVLFGDGTLSSVRSDLTSILTQTVWGVSSDFSMLGLVGINLDNEGQLSVKTDTLRNYLETNFNDVSHLFASHGSSSGSLEYLAHSTDTRAGEYTVHITNAPVRSNASSVDGGVAADETLTITSGDQTARIDLTSGMTLAQIVSSINGELDAVHTETLVGSESITTDGGANYITSATKWSEIFGAPALEDGDVISFSGTTRRGTQVSGQYQIQDVGLDSVQGLLSAMESGFSGEATATIDSYGRLVLRDKHTGTSQLSLEISEPAGKALDFGEVDVSPGADDGSQEGRYAMAITASDDGSGHLVLSHDSYGSGHSFSILESRNDGLWNQDVQIIVNNGEDVAGTINGEAAIGSGQLLTGAEDATSVAGLAVKYTGTAENVDVGRVKLTLGVAELFDRALFNITDPYDGYISFKQESLRNSISGFEDQIEQMEARLNQKMQLMIERFVAMETAISNMQSISSWLASQIQTLQSNWGVQSRMVS
jgi:flagellar hook-associated protein 2